MPKPNPRGPWPRASAFLRQVLSDLGPVEVVDVGANPIEGDAPYLRLLTEGRAHVTGFEPQDEAHAALLAAKSDHETYHKVALGSGGEETFHLFHHSGFASLFPVDPAQARLLGFSRATRPTGTFPVTTARLDDVEGIGRIDFLKIDVQGAETSILSGARARLADAVLVQTEVRFLPLYAGEPCFAGIDSELRAQGFMFHDFAFLKRVHLNSPSARALRPSQKRQVVDGDAFYIRDLSDLSRVTDDQLKRLALLADAVMEDAGLVLFCLDALIDRGAVPKPTARRFLAQLPAEFRVELAA